MANESVLFYTAPAVVAHAWTTIIMSLWSVDDSATQIMMVEFYTNLAKGLSKREAFLAAQNKVKTTAGLENPRYWAAFIMLDGNE